MDDGRRIVLDVWGGECSMDHVARFLPKLGECWPLAEKELDRGFLINLRAETEWGSMTPFDNRAAIDMGEGLLQ